MADACFHLASEAHMELGCLTHVPELLSRDLFQKVEMEWVGPSPGRVRFPSAGGSV